MLMHWLRLLHKVGVSVLTVRGLLILFGVLFVYHGECSLLVCISSQIEVALLMCLSLVAWHI